MERPSAEEVKETPEWQQYSETFSRALTELGEWTKPQADAWLQKRLLNPGFRSWFPHDPPSKELAELLMPDDLRGKLEGPPRIKLRQLIMDAIDLAGDEHNKNPDTDPNYDWEAARRRVTRVIEEFQKSYEGD